MIEIKSDPALRAYLAKPDDGARGGVILIHEVWGLVDHTKDVAERIAGEGYVVLAPDLLSDALDVKTLGGLQEGLFDPARRNQIQPQLRQLMAPMNSPEFGQRTLTRLKACFNYLYDLPEVRQKVAVIGYCFGGSYSFTLAVNEPRLKLAVPFYGNCDYSVSELKQITCPVRAFYGQNDAGIVPQLPDLKKRMKEAGVDFRAKVYPICGHAFFNDTNRFAYNEAAAKDAWQLTVKYLADTLA